MNSDTPDTTTADPPIDVESGTWPVVEIDPVAKLRALAAGIPLAVVDEALFDVPFERFWGFVGDLEKSTPRIEGSVHGVRILERRGDDRLRLEIRTLIGTRDEFEVVLRPGYCIMQSGRAVVGMAARPEGPHRTRYFHFEGARRFRWFLRPILAWNIRQDFRRLRRLLERESDPTGRA